MGRTALPLSLISHGAASVPKACASRIRLNPACIARPAAAAKKPKRPGSRLDGEPPAKRSRGACGEDEPDAADAFKIEKRPEHTAPPQPSVSSMRELLAKARTAAEAIRRRDIERRRAEARRELEQMVRTVEFNDP